MRKVRSTEGEGRIAERSSEWREEREFSRLWSVSMLCPYTLALIRISSVWGLYFVSCLGVALEISEVIWKACGDKTCGQAGTYH